MNEGLFDGLAGTAQPNWIDIALNKPNFVRHGEDFAYPSVAKIGGLVVVQGWVRSTSPAFVGATFGYLPVGYRPMGGSAALNANALSSHGMTIACASSTGYPLNVMFRANGEIYGLSSPSGPGSGGWVSLSGCWVAGG